ncbi:hypothetical protein P8605_01685 [Streptomyces sp. T-3]|nr:hypothetical protein [Streptomyces sp. T-3]
MTAGDDTAAKAPTTAWPLENVLFSAALAAQRIPWIDAPARALGLRLFTREHLTQQLLAQLKRTGSGRPIRLRTPFGTFLTPLSEDDARSLVARADAAGALGTVTGLTAEGRRQHVTPHVTMPVAVGPLPDTVGVAVAQEASRLIAARRSDGTVAWHDWQAVTQRLARRAVLGASAADDTLLSGILTAMTTAEDSSEFAAHRQALRRRLTPYLRETQGALASTVTAAGLSEGECAEAVEHLLALVTQVAGPALQALALVTVQPLMPPANRAHEAVHEALRRYPPMPMAVHQVQAPFKWRTLAIDADTEILCASAWLRGLDCDGEDRSDAMPAPLCPSPSPCAAAELATLVAVELVGALISNTRPIVLSPQLSPHALPHILSPVTLTVAFADSDTLRADGRVCVASTAVGAKPASGQSPAHYAGLARASAERLERQAAALTDRAAHTGWDNDAYGERSRMTLLAHAERCTKAAADVRRTAKWLAD